VNAAALRALAATALTLVTRATPLGAQDAQLPWLVSARLPSTLGGVADFRRDVAERITEMDRLLWAPGQSWFWRLGVGALLPDAADSAVARSRFDAVAGSSGESGGFRRSLDPVTAQKISVDVSGWQRVSSGSMVAGSARLEQASFGAGTASDTDVPYGSSPFALADTSTTAIDRLEARFNGVAAQRVGPLTLGEQAEFRSWERDSRGGGFSRLGRGVEQSVALSARADRLPLVQPFVMLGWHGGAETRTLQRGSQDALRYELFGLADVTGEYVGPGWYTRTEDEEPYGSVGVEASRGSWRAAGEWRRATRRQTQFHEQVDNPPRDRWTPTLDDGSLWVRWSPVASNWEFAAVLRHARLDGSATRALDTTAARFDAHEHRDVAALSAVGAPAAGWRAGLGVAIERFAQLRQTSAPVLVLDLTTTSLVWDGWAERQFSDRWSARAQVLASTSRADGTLPAYIRPGAAYATFLGPDMGIDGRDASRASGSLRVAYEVQTGLEAWVSVSSDAISARGSSVLGAAAPSGSRSITLVSAGFTRVTW
jgi:hypothetical protein